MRDAPGVHDEEQQQRARAHAEASSSPDLDEAVRQLGAVGRSGFRATGEAFGAFRTLFSADVSLARSALGRTLALTGVAIVFGASAWLLLMTTLIVFLSRQLGWPWSASLLLSAAISALIAGIAVRQGMAYFEHTRMQATRRQLARLGIGELADFVPKADSPQSTREAGERNQPQDVGTASSGRQQDGNDSKHNDKATMPP